MGDRAFAPLVAKGCEQPVLCQGGCPSRSSGYGCAFQASCQGACSRVGLGPEIYSAFCSPSSAPCSAVRSAFVQLEACLHLPPPVLHVPAAALSPDQGLRVSDSGPSNSHHPTGGDIVTLDVLDPSTRYAEPHANYLCALLLYFLQWGNEKSRTCPCVLRAPAKPQPESNQSSFSNVSRKPSTERSLHYHRSLPLHFGSKSRKESRI